MSKDMLGLVVARSFNFQPIFDFDFDIIIPDLHKFGIWILSVSMGLQSNIPGSSKMSRAYFL